MENNKYVSTENLNSGFNWYYILAFWLLIVTALFRYLPLIRSDGESSGVWLWLGLVITSIIFLFYTIFALIIKKITNRFISVSNNHNFIWSFISVIVAFFIFFLISAVIFGIGDVISDLSFFDRDPAYYLIVYPWFFLPALFVFLVELTAWILKSNPPSGWKLDIAPLLISISLWLGLIGIVA